MDKSTFGYITPGTSSGNPTPSLSDLLPVEGDTPEETEKKLEVHKEALMKEAVEKQHKEAERKRLEEAEKKRLEQIEKEKVENERKEKDEARLGQLEEERARRKEEFDKQMAQSS